MEENVEDQKKWKPPELPKSEPQQGPGTALQMRCQSAEEHGLAAQPEEPLYQE
jgi:hypothetical protein